MRRGEPGIALTHWRYFQTDTAQSVNLRISATSVAILSSRKGSIGNRKRHRIAGSFS